MTTDPADLFRLDGKVAIVTGASSGLGVAAGVATAVAYGVVATAANLPGLVMLGRWRPWLSAPTRS